MIKHLILLKIRNLIDERGLVTVLMNALIEKFPGGTFKCEFMINQHLAEEPHKPVIRKFKTKSIFIF